MILTEDDRWTFFPSVLQTGAALQGSILAAQTMAEMAAGRPLEITQFVDLIDIGHGDEPILKYYPVVQSMPVVIEYSQRSSYWRDNYFVEPVQSQPHWRLVDAAQYKIDADGRITFTRMFAGRLKVTYHAGFDFMDGSPESLSIKSSVASILRWQDQNRVLR